MNPNKFRSIVVLTGAGISAESGIQTFRDQNGLWENHRIEDVATPEAFIKNPPLVQEFYNLRRRQLKNNNIMPNNAHLSLGEFEKKFSGEFHIITQNIDHLHEQAHSKNILHMHGELFKVRCVQTNDIFTWHDDITAKSKCSCCKLTGTLRPHIVWFGEMPLFMDQIEQLLLAADLFISIGTSGEVYPASMFIQICKRHNPDVTTVEINLNKTSTSNYFDQRFVGPASREVPHFLKSLL